MSRPFPVFRGIADLIVELWGSKGVPKEVQCTGIAILLARPATLERAEKLPEAGKNPVDSWVSCENHEESSVQDIEAQRIAFNTPRGEGPGEDWRIRCGIRRPKLPECTWGFLRPDQPPVRL